jgi:RHS repeat-associated protein
MEDATGITYRTYDELNRNISKTVPGIGKSIYEYDLPAEEAGEYAERTTDPKGNVTLKTYDKAARLSKVSVGEDTTVYEYNRNGSRHRVIYPDGTTETYHYDRKNQITSLVNAKSDQSIISSYQYTYDPVGNQLSKAEGKGTTTYTYDSLNRLSTVSEPDGKVTTYTYDGAGNRKAEKVEKGLAGAVIFYAYNDQNRLSSMLSSDGIETKFLYDRNGNLLSKSSGKSELLAIGEDTPVKLPDFGLIIVREDENGTGTKHLNLNTYDHYNRLISSKTEKSTAKYRYNAQGYRVEKTVNDNTTRYLYEADKVVLETDENNNQEAFQAYGSNLLYRTTAADEEMGAQSYYYLYNAHGDVTALIDTQGNIAVTYDYDAFGNILSESGTANNSIKYAGYQYDEESRLYYLNARYYDSVTARFITEDTYTGQVNDPLSLNLYTYCENNPINYDDPTGHKKKAKKEEPKVDYFVDLKLQKTPYVIAGSIGAFVLQSEKWLKNIGYNVKIDGKFTKAEASALVQYEAKNKLRPTDGVIDNKTYANLMASNMKEQHKNDVKKGLKTQDELDSYNTYVDNLIKSPQFQNPDYTKDFHTYNYNKLLAHFGGGMEIYNALISLYPGGDAVDIATFAKDLASYKKGDEWKLVADLVALGIDGVGNFADEFIDSAKKAEKIADTVDNTKDLYRAVSPEEFDDIMSTKSFRGIEGKTLGAKEFGNNFDETLNFANKSINSDKAAIIKVTIPENIYNRLNHMNLDLSIFKSGTPVVEPEMLDIFNKNIIRIEHFY